MDDSAAVQLAIQLRAAYYANPGSAYLARKYRRALMALQPKIRAERPRVPRGVRGGVCSECGAPMHVGPDSAPPDRRRCQRCRKAHPKVRGPKQVPAFCLACGKAFTAYGIVKTCSRHCGGLVSAWKKQRPGEPFDREAMAAISEGRRMRRTVRSRQRHLRRAQTWDGITDLEIWERDGWRCQIPECLYRYRTINRKHKYPDPRSPGIDHIIPLSLGGDDTCVNKRAAHHGCNMARGNKMGDEQLPLIGSIREPPLTTQIAGTIRERRLPKPPKPKPERPKAPPRMTRCPCGKDFPARLAAKRGTVIRCPDCLVDLANRALALRQQGYSWKEVAATVGRASPGSLITLVQKYGGNERAA